MLKSLYDRRRDKPLMWSVLVVAVLATAYPLLISPVLASSIFLEPGAGNVRIGETIPVRIKVDTGADQVNAVSVGLTFPADKLALDEDWLDSGSSAFGVVAEQARGNGSVRISRGSIVGLSGILNFSTVNFTAKAAGKAELTVSPNSSAVRFADSSNSLVLSKGATITISDTLPVSSSASETEDGAEQNSAPATCGKKLKKVAGRLGQTSKLLQDYANRINSIESLLAAYYNNNLLLKETGLEGFADIQRDILKYKNNTKSYIDIVSSDSKNFDCSGDLTSQVRKFRSDAEKTKSALRDYLKAVKNLAEKLASL